MKFLLLTLSLLLISSCHHASFRSNNIDADKLAQQHNWEKNTLITDTQFNLVTYASKQIAETNVLTIFIEGDGFAWRNKNTPSVNSTPKDPVGLKLAITHNLTYKNSVYLARPCQFLDLKTQSNCAPKYWTSHRFAPEVIQSTNVAIDILKSKYKSTHIKLIGYSGGGAVASLVSKKRNDVLELVTIAGNLDTDAWTDYHEISPLSGSLNPADYWQDLISVPQIYYVGGKDKIMPPSIAYSYKRNFPDNAQPEIIIIESMGHSYFDFNEW